MTVTADARRNLTAVLTAGLADLPVPPTVSDTRPVELATPTVYVDVAARRFVDEDGAPVVVVTFPVVVIVDGDDPEQLRQLDDVGDLIWRVVLDAGGVPTSAAPGLVETGGPTLRTLTTLVDVATDHLTLCPDYLDPDPVGVTP